MFSRALDSVSESPDIDRWPLDDGLLDALRRLEPLELESVTTLSGHDSYQSSPSTVSTLKGNW